MRYEEFVKGGGTDRTGGWAQPCPCVITTKVHLDWTWWPSLNQRAMRRVAAYWFCGDMIIEPGMWLDISRDSDSGSKKSTLTSWLLFRFRIRLRLRPRPISPYTTRSRSDRAPLLSRSERNLSMSKRTLSRSERARSLGPRESFPRSERAAIYRSERTLLIQESSFLIWEGLL